MTSRSLYRVRAVDLKKRVERYADKPFSDGITIDDAGNVYISEIANSAIGVITTDREYRQLFQDDERLDWAEGFANAGDEIYVTTNKLHRSPAFNNEIPVPNKF